MFKTTFYTIKVSQIILRKKVTIRVSQTQTSISQIKCTILSDKSVSYTHNYKLSGLYPEIYFRFRPIYQQMTMLSVT